MEISNKIERNKKRARLKHNVKKYQSENKKKDIKERQSKKTKRES